MGLSSKQVYSDGIDWRQSLLQAQTLEIPKPPTMREQQQQNLQQQHDKLKCPRCDSTNTKFCYYNNYNKSQPRHFCKACKRHWTKGGTLRNVPVGGGRKNKRLKTSTTTATTTSASTATTKNNMSNRLNIHTAIQAQHRQNLPLAVGDDQKIMSDIFYQDLIRPPSLLLPQNFTSPSNLDSKNSKTDSSIFLPRTQNLLFPFSSSGSFERNPSSISMNFQSSNAYSYMGESKTMQDPSITSITATTSSAFTQQWLVPATSSGMDMSSNWNWDDIGTFTTTDLQIPWEDTEIKP